MIAASPALLARERQIFDAYTESLAALVAEETGARTDSIEPWVVANALIGVHRAGVDFARRRIVAGARNPGLARSVRRQIAGGDGRLTKAWQATVRRLARKATADRRTPSPVMGVRDPPRSRLDTLMVVVQAGSFMDDRIYRHFCMADRTLEMVGDRWTLLIVRDLLLGERRFTDLQRSLHDITPTPLTGRLRQLESAGIVIRDDSRPGRDVWSA